MKFRITILCLIAGCFSLCAQTLNATDAPRINVDGVGTVSAFPNAANITLALNFLRPTLKEAMAENKAATEQVLAVVNKYVADTENVKVSLIATDKVMRWNQQLKKDVFAGFESGQKIIFTLNDLSRLQEFTEEVMKTKIYEIERVSYFHTQGADFIKQAQEIAVADALATTKRLAKAADAKLGQIIYIGTDSSPANANRTTEEAYSLQSFSKGIEVKTVKSSGQLLNFTVKVNMKTLLEK